jgi:hypothetical protein
MTFHRGGILRAPRKAKLAVPLFVLIIALIAVDHSWADEKEKHELAVQLVDLTLSKQMYHEAHAAILARVQNWPIDLAHIEDVVNAGLEVEKAYLEDADLSKAKKSVAGVYERLFNEAELRKAVEFHKSDVGQKAVVNMPRMAMDALFMLNTQTGFPPKYEQMLLDKINSLKKQGKLPDDFSIEGKIP